MTQKIAKTIGFGKVAEENTFEVFEPGGYYTKLGNILTEISKKHLD